MQTSAPRRSSVSSLWLAFVIIIVTVALVSALAGWLAIERQKATRTCCLNNLKQVGCWINMYSSDWDDHYPPLRTKAQHAPVGKAWPETIGRYVQNKRVLCCPASNRVLVYSYNSRLAGMKEWDMYPNPESPVMLFESVNDSRANNNLNGCIVWHAKAGELPPVGSFVPWTKDAIRMSRAWPEWAKPRHGTIANVLFADGHAQSMEGWDPTFTLSPK